MLNYHDIFLDFTNGPVQPKKLYIKNIDDSYFSKRLDKTVHSENRHILLN